MIRHRIAHRRATPSIGALLLLAPLTLPIVQESEPPLPPRNERALTKDAELGGSTLPPQLERELANRLRILDVAAHPDDEDGGLLHLHALQGAEVTTLFSTQGEGGQNAIGSALDSELGALREEETVAASAVVGSTPWFLGFPDFGFSKRAEETFSRWGGRDEVVRRITFAIRRLRPHRVFTNHAQTGGHGHHQATSIALHEAVVAASDPARYPEQIAAGLEPWTVDALFVRITEGEPPPDTTFHFDYDVPSAVPDRTIAALAYDALTHHASQGPWAPFDPAKRHESNYALTWSATPLRSLRELPARQARMPTRDATTPFTVADLLALLALPAFNGEAAPSEERVDEWLTALLGAELIYPDDGDLAARALVTGEPLRVLLLLHGRDPLYRGEECAAAVRRLELDLALTGPAEITARADLAQVAKRPELIETWRDALCGALSLQVNATAPASFPAAQAPSTPWSAARHHPLAVRLGLRRGDSTLANLTLPIAKPIAPALIGELEQDPLTLVRPPGAAVARGTLRLSFPSGRVPHGKLRLKAPAGCDFESLGARLAELPVELTAAANLGSAAAPRFAIPFVLRRDELPPPTADRTSARLSLEFTLAFADGAPIATVQGELAVIDALPPKGSRVAFVEGSDGSAGRALDDLGVPCTRLTPAALAREELRGYTHVLLDARTWGNAALRAQSTQLRDFAARGGHVIALYHKRNDWNDAVKAGQSPAALALEIADVRVCEEQAPIRILAPGARQLIYPNVILARDFDGWVQERGLYFGEASDDAGWQELLECADAGETAHRGGLLVATTPGGGSFTYCAYALHRQLRAGHSGAWRLFANLMAPPPVR